MNRREFLKFSLGGAGLALASTAGIPAWAAGEPDATAFWRDFWSGPRELWLTRQATGENHRVLYHRGGALDPNGYAAACWMLRDVQANKVVAMDTTLLDVLYAMQGWLFVWNYRQPIIVTSGYRTRHTNDVTEGAVRNSMHLAARAVDLKIPGLHADYVGRLASYFHRGGIGFYYRRDFIHLDTGRVRAWTGR